MLTIKEAAAKLGRTTDGVLKMIKRGDLSAKRLGNMWVINPVSFAALVKRTNEKKAGK